MRELLHGMGLAPSDDPDVFNWSRKAKQGEEKRKPEEIYVLRRKPASEKLDEYSLGRVFMHLLNHRGFIGSPKEDSELEAGEQQDLTDEQKEKLKESKKRNDDIKLFNDEIGDRTLGAVHVQRMGLRVPEEGEVRFLQITDRQYGDMIVFTGKKRKAPEESPAQLEFF